MDLLKAYSRRSFFIIVLFIAVVAGGMIFAFQYGFEVFSKDLVELAKVQTDIPEVGAYLEKMAAYRGIYIQWFIMVTAGIFAVIAFFLWVLLRIACGGLFKKASQRETPQPKSGKALSAEAKKAQREKEKRLFLYHLNLFQREGRLLDFLSEDLDLYEDEQIGAAVRSIHEGCRNAVNKSLVPKPVIDQEEGEEVTIETGFDPSAVKLTGNVTGQPPFKGILRHKGWRSGKLELPKFSGDQDAAIIAPAEVEIE